MIRGRTVYGFDGVVPVDGVGGSTVVGPIVISPRKGSSVFWDRTGSRRRVLV